ncbi:MULTISPECIES: type II secretion system protein N [Candidatus Ichthyocystis]|uniref:Type II secretion system protein N n=1 Tax=Candidatus Ichthyocystis hellenicum TaxID=1561003 RepID=A0A0S4M2H7_9BURK|nr:MULTISPECIES: type II secretion system protein N [Ichthyocystis]CUT17215.1 putative type II secretion system protein N [Candidatus Ichthyocystis hellenicum]
MKKFAILIAVVMGVICFMPSSALNFFFRQFDVPLAINNGSGTVWSGEGDLFFSPYSHGALKSFRILERLKWDVQFSHIFSRGLVLVFSSDQFQESVTLSLMRKKISLSRFKIFSNAELLEHLGEPFHTILLQGLVVLDSGGMVFADSTMMGGLSIHFGLISSHLVPNVNVLGNYDINLHGDVKGISIDLSSRGDALVLLKGSGSVDLRHRRVEFRGFAEPTKKAPVAVKKILQLIGRRIGSRTVLDGKFSW